MTALIVLLLGTGAALLVAEAHVTSYGVLGLAGIAALVAGGVLAVDAAGGSVFLAFALALPVAAGLIALVAVAGRKSLEVGRRRPLGGADGLVGRVGVVRRARSRRWATSLSAVSCGAREDPGPTASPHRARASTS
jgi:membrane-bound serine protease (ClpP class)